MFQYVNFVFRWLSCIY